MTPTAAALRRSEPAPLRFTLRRAGLRRVRRATPSPRRCWPTACTGSAHQHPARPAARHLRRRRRGAERARADRGAVPGADAAGDDRRARTTGWSPAACPAGAGWPASPTRPATTRCTRTATCWSSGPARPGRWPPPRRPRPPGDPRRSSSTELDGRPLDGGSPRRAARPLPRYAVLTRTTVFGVLRRRLRRSPSSGAPTTSARPPRRTCPGSGSGASGPAGRAGHRRARAAAGVRRQRPARRHAGRRRPHYLHRYGVLAGRRAVVFTTNDSAYAAALDLPAAGVEIAAVVDARPEVSPPWTRRCAPRGIDVLDRSGRHRHRRASERVTGGDCFAASPAGRHRAGAGPGRGPRCSSPAAGTRSAAPVQPGRRGRSRYDERPRRLPSRRGLPPGRAGRTVALAGGRVAADRRAITVAAAAAVPVRRRPTTRHHFVDLQRDVTVGRPRAGHRRRACARSSTSSATPPSAPRTTRARRPASLASARSGRGARRRRSASSARPRSGRRTRRSPSPRSAGRDRGPLLRPGPGHRHARLARGARGAVFENVGQWKRPWYYPRDGEDMTRRCCASAGPPARAWR